jgi:RNA polymerase sigma-70 factor (ECF subfamily)
LNFPPPERSLPGEAPVVPVTPQHLYEHTLVLRAQLGDEAAFRELLILHAPRLLAFVRRMMSGAPDLAEDLAQEIWVAIFRGLPTLLDVTKFRPWAFRIARDRIYREFRRRKLPVDSMHDVDVENLADIIDPDPAIDPEELQNCLAAVSPEHREVLVLRFFEELDYEEIARVTGSTLGTVRSRIHYAKRALRRACEDKLYEHKSR